MCARRASRREMSGRELADSRVRERKVLSCCSVKCSWACETGRIRSQVFHGAGVDGERVVAGRMAADGLEFSLVGLRKEGKAGSFASFHQSKRWHGRERAVSLMRGSAESASMSPAARVSSSLGLKTGESIRDFPDAPCCARLAAAHWCMKTTRAWASASVWAILTATA